MTCCFKGSVFLLQICYFFYKNIVFGFSLFLYEIYTSFSAQPAYNDWFLSLYNVFFTSLPAVALGVFDQDVSARFCLKVMGIIIEFAEEYIYIYTNTIGLYSPFMQTIAPYFSSETPSQKLVCKITNLQQWIILTFKIKMGKVSFIL